MSLYKLICSQAAQRLRLNIGPSQHSAQLCHRTLAMPEVTIVKHKYKLKAKTVPEVSFENAAFVERQFGSVQAFLQEFGAGRRVRIADQEKFAVVCGINKCFVHTCVGVLTKPVVPPWTVPPGGFLKPENDHRRLGKTRPRRSFSFRVGEVVDLTCD